jgi:hypothetical protein
MRFQYTILLRAELRRQLLTLAHAARTQPGTLRHRELDALKVGLRALAEGREAEYDGQRLGYSSKYADLRDCAEIKLPVVVEMKFGHELGPSHRLVYREFDAADRPVREAICFEHRRDDRPFTIAAQRLKREIGVRASALRNLPNSRPAMGDWKEPSRPVSPPRRPLPADLEAALKAAKNPAASGAPVRGSSTSRPTRPARASTGREL